MKEERFTERTSQFPARALALTSAPKRCVYIVAFWGFDAAEPAFMCEGLSGFWLGGGGERRGGGRG